MLLNFVDICVLLLAFQGGCYGDQNTIDYLASSISIEYYVDDNLNSPSTFDGRIILENRGSETVTDLSWSLYLSSFKLFEPDTIRPDGADLGDSGLRVHHVNGYLYKIQPNSTFPGLAAGQRLVVPFKGQDFQVTVTEIMPNWYFVSDDAEPRVCTSTAGTDFSWVGPFDTPNKWKRSNADTYDPYTGPVRLDLQNYTDLGGAPSLILPTPVEEMLDVGSSVDLGTGDWVVVIGDPLVQADAEFLADALGTVAVDPEFTPYSRFIKVSVGEVYISEPEAYRLDISTQGQNISITGIDPDGTFNGIQSLLSLYAASTQIPGGQVVDFPRFHYRGQHIDVSRHFYGKEHIKRHLDAMAMYKLNKLHFHLTNDEGWRLEIPGLPELTGIGSRRCHDLTGDFCILPQFGSAPGLANDGTGYYSVADYREILAYAEARHIQVIPEFNMPGHANAAVKAMLARYRNYIDTNETAATEFLLTDLDDTSDYISIQGFKNNSINACVNSTYNFVTQIVREIKAMHQDIQPLTTFNFGGDEVPSGAWVGSPACNVISSDNSVIKKMFVQRVAEIAFDEGLDVSGWNDGFMEGNSFYNVSTLPNEKKYAYAWTTVFEWGDGEKPYLLANAGYKTILSPATHAYFDFPYEPDPYELGHMWATRIIPASKTFSFMPDDIYANIGVTGNGNELDPEELCSMYSCTPLEVGKEENIIGFQSQLWSELVRKPEQLDYMIFPRVLALAERAWHRASWETEADLTERERLRTLDWERFANTLGYKELARLDAKGVKYAISPPGARIAENNRLEAMAGYPGLTMLYSTDGGQQWLTYQDNITLQPGTVYLLTLSADGSRTSRQTELTVI